MAAKIKEPVVISIQNVSKIYQMGTNIVKALNNVSLDITKDDFVSIMGHSGSGKSTMMNIVGCLDKPTYGTVKLNGIDIARLEDNELAKIRGKSIGFIFQQFNLIPTLTALENVMLPAQLQDEKNEVALRKRASKLLEIVGLENRMHHKPNELSGGQQQRVAIARALMNDPEIILADEPTGNLDTGSGEAIMELLNDLHIKEHKTIVLVTHEPDVARYSHRIIFLKDGKIIEEREMNPNHDRNAKFKHR